MKYKNNDQVLSRFLCMIVMTLSSTYLISTSFAKPVISGFQGGGDQLKSEHLKPHLVSNENYVEKYTFNADFKSSTGEEGRLYFSISINNIGAGDHKLRTKGILTIGEERIKWSSKRKSGQWKSAKDSFKITAGGVELSGDPQKMLTFKVSNKQGQFKIMFRPIVKPWRPQNGGLSFSKSSEKAQFSLFPFAEVKGEWSLANGIQGELTGEGWGRHTWSHLGPHEWSQWSQLIRIFDRDAKRSVFIRRVKIGGDYAPKTIAYAIATEGSKTVFEGYNVDVKASKTYTDKKHDNRYQFPTDFTLKASDQRSGDQLSLKLKTNRRLYRRNPIGKLSWVKRKVVELVTKPMEYAYEFDYDVAISGKSSIKMSGHKGRYEVFHLN